MRPIARSAPLILCAIAGQLLSAAQAPEAAAQSKKQPPPGILQSVTIKGSHLYSAAAIFRATGLVNGQKIDSARLEAVRNKLQATELFTNVIDEFKFSGGKTPAYDVTFEVTEVEQTYPMRFERLGVSAEAIQKHLRENMPLYADRIPGTDDVLHRYSAAVQEFVSFSDPKIKVKAAVTNDDPKELTVLFTSTAPAQNISRVIVTGNQAVDTGTILRAVNQIAVGVPLSDARLKMILEGTIKPLYAAKGYAAVTFPKIDTEPSTANLGVVVKVQIQDGPQFKFGGLRFRGSGLDEDEVRANIPFKSGQLFDGDKVDNFRLDLTKRMKRRGLLDANITVDTEPDDSKRTVAVVFNVLPGSIYNFGRLDIHGLDGNTEPVIAKLWGEKPGKPFNPEYPDFFLKRVAEQGLLENLKNTESDYKPDEATHTVTVNLYFKGGESDAEKRKKAEEQKRIDGTSNPPTVN